MNPYSEDVLVQRTTASFLRDELGWDIVDARKETFGPDGSLGRMSDREVVLTHELEAALRRLNPGHPDEAYRKAITELTSWNAARTLVDLNRETYAKIRDGVKVAYFRPGSSELTECPLKVIDFDKPSNNHFLAVREFWVQGPIYHRRADIIGFVNGLPLLFIELKRSSKDIKTAYVKNFSDYKDTIPHLFQHNALVILSNGIAGRVGTISGQFEHFYEWKRRTEDEEGDASFETMLRLICEKQTFIDLIENFIVFDQTKDGLIKIFARNHQYLGVNRALEAVSDREKRAGRLGVFWHTQGSGKSYSMVYLTRKIHRKLSAQFTFVIVTDREELDDQISKTFAGVGAVEEARLHRAGSGKHLEKLVRSGSDYIFTLVHKFNREEAHVYSERSDIIVMADEAHRTQYGDLAIEMRRVLPRASFIAFTGTPLMESEEDQLTRAWFGDYVSKYPFNRAIADQATVPLLYDNRGERLKVAVTDLNERIAHALRKYEEELKEDPDKDARLRAALAREYPILTAPERLEKIAKDLVAHMSERWANGKAMLVCIDKVTCVKMHELVQLEWEAEVERQYQRVEELTGLYGTDSPEAGEAERRLDWLQETEIRVIVSDAQNEVETFKKWRESDTTRPWKLDILRHRAIMNNSDSGEDFKSAKHPFRLAIVCAMWLTGFDVPSLSTLYIDKPMKGHSLMQAIARVNRIYESKNNGLLVDYNGMLSSLKEAIAKFGQGGYGQRAKDAGGDTEPNMDVLEREYAAAIEAAVAFLEQCGFELQKLIDAAGFQRLKLLDKDKVGSAVEVVSKNDESRRTFSMLVQVAATKRLALQGRSDLLAPHKDRFEALRAIAEHLKDNQEKADITAIIADLYGVVGEAIEQLDEREPGAHSGKVLDLSKIDLARLEAEFKKSKKKQTVILSLTDALQRQLSGMISRNPLRINFQKRFEEIVAAYNRETERATLEAHFEALVSFTQELTEEEQRGVREGLEDEQLAVFDLLVKNKSELDKRAREKVKQVARELLFAVKAALGRFQDWRSKEQTQADMRITIRDLLWDESRGLPSSYQNDEIDLLAVAVFEHVYTQYPSANGNALVPGAA
ncbi:MAG: type I restriction endonuclease subunit R [Fimbriimonadaceae bacterium]|nr:type I restriction endonuclease subunit R [Fimbriimonadaceae bacterium]